MKASKAAIPVDVVRDWVTNSTVAFGIPAYNEGDGILPTLRSLWQSLTTLGLTDCRLMMSESHDESSLSSVEPASQWARSVGASLDVDSAARRRPKKEAINNLFNRSQCDVLIILDADVVVPIQSLLTMLYHLYAPPRPAAVAGATLPDPSSSGLKHRAGAWQLRAVTRAALLAPRLVDPSSPRVEGAFWGSWREFYSKYRLTVGSGSIAEDVEIARALSKGGFAYRNVPEAFVYKVPPGSLVDMCLGTIRSQVAIPDHRRRGNEYKAALIEGARDPLGALLYATYRIWCRRNRSRLLRNSASEQWNMLNSTKRKTTRL